MSQSPFAKKPAVSSTKVLAPPGGGAQTFNLFGGDEPVQQQRSSIGVNPTGNATSIHSPFSKDPQAAPTPERRSSIAANPNSNNFKSDVNSPFSKEPLPRKGRQNSMVNVPSQDSPFSAQTSAPEQTGSTWTPKANVPSDDNPFNSAPPPAPSTPQRPFTANKPSEHNPFTTSSDAPLPATVPPPREFRANHVSDSSPFNESNSSIPQQNLSIKPQASPGGKSNINLFAPPPEVVVSTKLTPTYGYTQDSPFNKDPQASPNGTIKRRESRVNVPSTENPFFNSEPVQQSVSSYQPKANVPSDNSPFSNSPMPQLKNDRDAANRPSADNPFNQSSGNTNASGQQRGPSTRVLQTPGGNQSFNVFSHNQ